MRHPVVLINHSSVERTAWGNWNVASQETVPGLNHEQVGEFFILHQKKKKI